MPTKASRKAKTRNLVIVLGDQLNRNSAAFDDYDKEVDAVWMAEVSEESEHVWSHKVRIALFLAAMRHFRKDLERRGFTVHYQELPDGPATLASSLQETIKSVRPERLIMVQAGEHRVHQSLIELANEQQLTLELREDRHFFSTPEQFAEHARGRKQLRLEYFYRELRRRHDILMDGNKPEGGKWNYDAENRGSFGKKGPATSPPYRKFKTNPTTKEVLQLVAKRFADHPGSLEHFDWPVTPKQALQALDDFIEHRLSSFGQYQDAMWTDEPYLYHSRLSAAMNLKLLDPRDVVEAAIVAYRANRAPLNAVEGFVRQILGWREYVRGIYWLYMPEYLERNTLKAGRSLPEFYWSGETDFHCLQQAIGQTLEHGYAHHIQRLMVTGLFAMLLGVNPQQVHRWYLAVYVDAIEWVELPNSLGMSQFADDGVMASKPYAATGKYIQRMSNYCTDCAYDPSQSTGERACPFTTLYWDFLIRHEKTLAKNQRMSLQVRNLERLSSDDRRSIQQRAKHWKNKLTKPVATRKKSSPAR